jgi:tetratricopeptide (TPR) repeat protein
MVRGSPAYNWTLIGVATAGIVAALVFMRAPLFFPLALVGSMALCGGFELRRRSLFRRRMRAVQEAIEAEDLAAADAAIAALSRSLRRPQGQLFLRLVRASLPLIVERFAEARAQIEAINCDGLHPALHVARDNDLAWAMAHDGAALEALSLAERAATAAIPEAAAEVGAACVGTLGVVQLKAGRAAEARETLERALALGGSPRMMATRAFYLGEALQELGYREEAALAYDRAVRAKPDGIYGKKARAALAVLAAEQPYRG